MKRLMRRTVASVSAVALAGVIALAASAFGEEREPGTGKGAANPAGTMGGAESQPEDTRGTHGMRGMQGMEGMHGMRAKEGMDQGGMMMCPCMMGMMGKMGGGMGMMTGGATGMMIMAGAGVLLFLAILAVLVALALFLIRRSRVAPWRAQGRETPS